MMNDEELLKETESCESQLSDSHDGANAPASPPHAVGPLAAGGKNGIEKYQPKVLVFACNWCSYAGADTAGVARLQMPANCRVVRVMCSARVAPEMVLSALFKGLDAVLVLGCHPGDCHYSEGNYYTRRRALVLQKLLDTLGIAKERFQVRWISAAEGEKFAKTIREVVEQVSSLGPNSIGKVNGR